MKRILSLVLLLSLSLTTASCMQINPAPSLTPASSPDTTAATDAESLESHIQCEVETLPTDITDGASEIFTSMLDQEYGYLLKRGYPAAGQMFSFLYRTTDGNNWKLIRELHDDVHNYPKSLLFWSKTDGVILTNYHGYEDCVYITHDGGDSWHPVPILVPDEIRNYSYYEGENARVETGKLLLELSAHFEDKNPVIFTVSIDASTE